MYPSILSFLFKSFTFLSKSSSEIDSSRLISVDSKPIAILNNHFLGLTFHPELDGIKIFHEVLFNPNSKVYYKKISKGYET